MRAREPEPRLDPAVAYDPAVQAEVPGAFEAVGGTRTERLAAAPDARQERVAVVVVLPDHEGLAAVELRAYAFLLGGYRVARPAEHADVGGTDVGDERAVGLVDAGEDIHLAGAVDTHLEYGGLVLRADEEHRRGKAYIGIEVSWILYGSAGGAYDGGEQLLGAGLPRRTGNAEA
jgi:hypothetical protein